MKDSPRVLNLDDNVAARYLKARALQLAGFEVIDAGTGMEALRIAREQRPDIALLDVKLPDISGLEVCRQLKSDPRTSDIPVVQISATHVTDGDQAAGLEHGADIYLTEPMESIVLVTVVRTLLRLRLTESGLLASEERFKAIVNQATAGIVQTDLSGRFLHVNQRYCDMVGRSAEDLCRLGLLDVTFPADIEQSRMLFNRLVAAGTSFGVEKRYVRPDGAVVWASNSVSLVRDKQGVAQHAIAIVVDITERKRAEERERFLAEVSERLAELTDQASTLKKVTGAVVPAMADWCAVDLIESDGTHKRVASSHVDPSKKEFLHPLGASRPEKAVDVEVIEQVLQTRRSELIENISDATPGLRSGDESRLRALHEFGLKSYICVPLILREQLVGTLAMGTGSSGRNYHNGDLILAAELGRRVTIAVENANLYHAIRESARKKDEFLATLAHELRNPLAPLRNSLQVMRKAADDSELVEQARGIMERQVSQLHRLVDDLLDVSRITTGKVELRRTSALLSSIVNSAVEAVRDAIEERHKLTIALPSQDVYLHVDPARIAQIITNLLDNAAKYTPPGGEVSLVAEQQGNEISITVTDTGIGIAADMLHQIFDMFVQADNSFERAHGGLGIGLTLVKRLVEMHGGRINARSPGLGKGSSFILRLPVAAGNDDELDMSSTAGSGSAGAGHAAKRNIVVVDDNRDSASSLGALLELMGHVVHIANDGPQALLAVAEHRPEIVFLDIGLPGMNGYEVARRLRGDEANKSIFVVALSGYGTAQDRQRSQEAGFDRHIIKPIELDELQRIMTMAASH